MKKILTYIAFILAPVFSFAQADAKPLYLQFPEVPPFSILKVPDSTKFTKDHLTKRKATLIILFSPDCDHCQQETRELQKNISLFKNVQIVMAAQLDYDLIKKFYDEFDLASYPNITVGREGTFFLSTFFKNRTFPTLFLYNKKGKFVERFEGSVPVQTIAEKL
ncbi:MAG TPA: thioredoxin domain-containing protein [Ferruginibacter sp.]|nr:thioredoxin domain-containing protein [Ferruginibacter sp.]HMP22222.1 thioredoxin domain-containing protein [Ferruginibacter sp.]